MANVPLEIGERLARHQIPLVGDGDDAGLRFQSEPDDVEVLRRHPLRGVEDDERRVGSLQRVPGAQGGVMLYGLMNAPRPAQTGGVNQDEAASGELKRRVDSVTGGPRNVGNDHTVLTENGVQQH